MMRLTFSYVKEGFLEKVLRRLEQYDSVNVVPFNIAVLRFIYPTQKSTILQVSRWLKFRLNPSYNTAIQLTPNAVPMLFQPCIRSKDDIFRFASIMQETLSFKLKSGLLFVFSFL